MIMQQMGGEWGAAISYLQNRKHHILLYPCKVGDRHIHSIHHLVVIAMLYGSSLRKRSGYNSADKHFSEQIKPTDLTCSSYMSIDTASIPWVG